MTCISLKHYLQQTQRHCSDGSHVKTRDGQQQQGEESGSHVHVRPLKNPGELNFMGILVIRLMRKKLKLWYDSIMWLYSMFPYSQF